MSAKQTSPGGVTPYLIVKGAAEAIAFYAEVFGARETFRIAAPDGGIAHANLLLAGGAIMLADEHPDFGAFSPPSLGGTPVKLHVTVESADAVVARAERAGATVLRPVQDQLQGERSGMIADPFGHQWFIGQRIEDVTPKQMQARYDSSS